MFTVPTKPMAEPFQRECAALQRTQFTATQWTEVLSAAGGRSPEAEKALENLCRRYWYPLYAYVRRRGHDPHQAQDLTQGFFEQMLEKGFLTNVERNKGKFRSFLLACLNNFLAKAWRDQHTLKRGGAVTFLPLDPTDPEERLVAEPAAATLGPEELYDHQWALALLEQTIDQLQLESAEAGKAALFEALKPFLVATTPDGSYDSVAVRLGMTPHAVGMAVMRLRKRYRELIRAAVAETVTNQQELEEELRYLRSVLAR